MNQDTNEKGITKGEMVELLTVMLSNLKIEIVKQLDTVVSVLDARIDSGVEELKKEIRDMKTDMNQRFLTVDNRLLNIETNMVRKDEFLPLVKRVHNLEIIHI